MMSWTYSFSTYSWIAEDLLINQCDENSGSLELNVGVREAVCTCKTIELFSSSGYLKSIRGNVVEVITFDFITSLALLIGGIIIIIR